MRGLFSAALIIFLALCGGPDKDRREEELVLKSPAFKYGKRIPGRYTCDGENISPEFVWSGVPANAKSLVLICEDLAPESNLFVHWVVYNIPPASKGLPRNVPHEAQLPDGSRQAYNTRSQLGYLGPCPGNETHMFGCAQSVSDSGQNPAAHFARYHASQQADTGHSLNSNIFARIGPIWPFSCTP